MELFKLEVDKMSILALIAYRRTGKDTLLNKFSSLHYYRGEEQSFWIVYVNPLLNPQYVKAFLHRTRRRVAFADKLKENVHLRLGLREVKEEDKDKLLIQGQTLRQHYLEEGRRGREQSPDYWIKQALPDNLTDDIAITDVRFHNELCYLEKYETLTCRLFRSLVQIPPLDEPSEHSLDKVSTDLLMVTSVEEYEKALDLFPQYRGYLPQLIIK